MYSAKVVSDIIDYYGPLLYNYPEGITIKQRLERLALLLWKAVQSDNAVVKNQINNYHPAYLSKDWTQIKAYGFSETDAYDTIAYEYGFKGWTAVPEEPINISFAKAIDTLLAGDVRTLEQMIVKEPELLEMRSPYAHRATLLHYVGSNGVELYRQVVPVNLADCMTLLLQHGADKDATMPVYNGQFTMIELLRTSAHPKASGRLSEVESAYKLYEDQSS